MNLIKIITISILMAFGGTDVNPFKHVVGNQKDLKVQSIGSVASGLLEFGKFVFGEDIKSAIAGRLDPECKEYREQLMEDGRKYRKMVLDFYEFQNSIK